MSGFFLLKMLVLAFLRIVGIAAFGVADVEPGVGFDGEALMLVVMSK